MKTSWLASLPDAPRTHAEAGWVFGKMRPALLFNPRRGLTIKSFSGWAVAVMLHGCLMIPAQAGTLTLLATGGGTLTAEPALETYPDGTKVTVTASAPPGIWLQEWGVDVPDTSRWTGQMTQTVTINGNRILTARFGPLPAVRLFKMGGDGFRAYRMSPNGRFALGATFPDANSMGKPAFRDRDSRAVTIAYAGDGKMRDLSEDGLRGVGYAWNEPQSGFSWTPQDTKRFPTGIFAEEISADGWVVGATRFLAQSQSELVTFGLWRTTLPNLGVANEYYGALSGNGTTLYSFQSYRQLIRYDRSSGSRFASSLPEGWLFYPYNADFSFPAGTNHDGRVLVAAFEVEGTTQAALYRDGQWSRLPGLTPSAVFRLSGNGALATGYAGPGRPPTVWRLDSSEPIQSGVADYLTADGAWMAPIRIGGVDDVSDDGMTLLFHEDEGEAPYPPSGWKSPWIAIRPRIVRQSITFPTPVATYEKGAPIPLVASATSGLPVQFRLVSGPGRVFEGVYYPESFGSAVVEAVQPGGEGDFVPAPPVLQTWQVQDDPSISEIHTAASPGGRVEGGPATSFVAVNAPLALRAVPEDSDVRAFHSWQATSTWPDGTTTSHTHLFPDFNFQATNGRHQLTARFATAQSITFVVPEEIPQDAWRIPLAATSSSGLPSQIVLVDGPGRVEGGWYYPEEAGEVVLVARQPGSDDVAPAVDVVRRLRVLPDLQAPLIQLDQPPAFTVATPTTTIGGLIVDDAARIELTVIDGSGQVRHRAELAPPFQFEVPAMELSLGLNEFMVRVRGGALVTETRLLITWRPDQLITLDGPALADEARRIPIELELNSNGKLAGMTVALTYSPDLFLTPEFTRAAELGLVLLEINDSTPGLLQFTLATPGLPLPAGPSRLGSFTLRSRSFGSASADAVLRLSVSGLSDDTGAPITEGVHSVGTSFTLRPRAHIADVNNNGRWDVGDATRIQQFLAGWQTARPWDHELNDLNQSGGLDTGDVVKILRAAALIDPNISSEGRAARDAPDAPAPLVEAVGLVPLNPMAVPGAQVTFEARASSLLTPLSGTSLAIDYPAELLQTTGDSPFLPGPYTQAGSMLRIGQMASPTQGMNRLTLAASTAASYGQAGNPLTLASFALQLRPAAASAFSLPLRLHTITLAGPDGYDVRQPSSSTLLLHPHGTSFEAWKSTVFTLEEATDPSVSGFLADPDGDGIPNALEFHLGSPPLINTAASPISVSVGDDGHARFRFTHLPEVTGSRLIPEWSPDLGATGWQSTGLVAESETVLDDGRVETVLKAPAAAKDLPFAAFRLISQPQP